MSFRYKGDEMPLELTSCLCQLAYGEIGFIRNEFTAVLRIY